MRFFKVALAGCALALLVGGSGCASSHCLTKEECAKRDAQRQRGQELASQVGCDGKSPCGKPGHPANCGQCKPQEPQPPIVIKEPCETTSPLVGKGLKLNGDIVLRVKQITNAEMVGRDCDGNECTIATGSDAASSETVLPLEAVINTGGHVTLGAKPGQAPCGPTGEKKAPEPKPSNPPKP